MSVKETTEVKPTGKKVLQQNKDEISNELTKTKAKKCLMINYGDESDKKMILQELKKFDLLFRKFLCMCMKIKIDVV